jgi:hypothetical protein
MAAITFADSPLACIRCARADFDLSSASGLPMCWPRARHLLRRESGWRDLNPRPLRPERHHQRLWSGRADGRFRLAPWPRRLTATARKPLSAKKSRKCSSQHHAARFPPWTNSSGAGCSSLHRPLSITSSIGPFPDQDRRDGMVSRCFHPTCASLQEAKRPCCNAY